MSEKFLLCKVDLVISKHYSCAGSPVTCVSILSEQVGLLGLIVLFRMVKEHVGVSVDKDFVIPGTASARYLRYGIS